MVDEEVEVVAEELAKIGGVPWSLGRQPGPLMHGVTDRYRAQARVVIAALEWIRTGSEPTCAQDLGGDGSQKIISGVSGDQFRPGATVIYRPLGDRRTYPCRVVEIQGERAYLAPILRTCIGWISIERLQSATDEADAAVAESAMSGDGNNG
jgi:hypothetical protein